MQVVIGRGGSRCVEMGRDGSRLVGTCRASYPRSGVCGASYPRTHRVVLRSRRLADRLRASQFGAMVGKMSTHPLNASVASAAKA
eukprot:6209809-Pleurochrysis_carterae.AAC.3